MERGIDMEIGMLTETSNGYLKIKIPGHALQDEKGWVYYHHMVAYAHLGFRGAPDEVVHHIDKDIRNNEPGNLQILTNSDHLKLHWAEGASGFFREGVHPRAAVPKPVRKCAGCGEVDSMYTHNGDLCFNCYMKSKNRESRATRQPCTCPHCGREKRVFTKGRCEACYRKWLRAGRPRETQAPGRAE